MSAAGFWKRAADGWHVVCHGMTDLVNVCHTGFALGAHLRIDQEPVPVARLSSLV